MKRLVLLLFVVAFAGCSGSTEPVECWIVAPVEGDVVSETAEVRIGFSGPATVFEVLVDGDIVAEGDDGDATDGVATLEWDTSEHDDGAVEITVRVEGSGSEHEGEPLDVVIDNTAPEASLDIERMSMLEGQVDVPVTVTEENIAAARLMSGDTELASVTELDGDFPWDTTTATSGFHSLSLVVEDVAGRSVETSEVLILVVNNAHHLTADEFAYDPGAWASPSGHTRVQAPMAITGLDPENIVRVITWLSWDDSDWTLDYAMGQGFCPHRGIAYMQEESNSGEIILDIAWTELETVFQNAGRAQDPDHPADAESFPYNGDPATRGNFFGHVNVIDAGGGTDVEIEVNFIFFYGA